MKSIAAFVLFLLLPTGFLSRCPAANPIPIAHRGMLRHAPENTLPAFAKCLERGMGFELDIRTTKDGRLVVIHDDNLRRTTDGPNRSVRDLTLAELKRLDAGSWFDKAFAGERVPTLDETLALVRERKQGATLIALNVKHLTRAGEAKLVALVEKHNLLTDSFAFDQSDEMSRRLKQLNPAFRIGQNVRRNDIDARLKEGLLDCFLLTSTPTADEVALLHDRGRQVLYNYAGTGPARRNHANWKQAAAAGIDGMLTDYPLECGAVWLEADIRKRLGNYDEYQTSEIFSAGDATVRIKAFNDLGWHIVVIPDKPVGRKGVVLKMTDAPTMEGYTFTPERPKYQYWRKTGDSVDLSIMPEGWGWYFLRKPIPPASSRRPGPKQLITARKTDIKKAKHPVVDVHTHVLLSFPAPGMYLKVMDQAGVAVLVDSPLATFDQQTKDGYLKMEKFHPDRFITFGTIDFSDRHQEGFSEAAIAKLESDVGTMGIAGVGETHDKGAGVYGHALRPDARGPVHVNDERLMPIWRAAAQLKLPVLFHIAEPIGNYAPYGEHPRERWGYVSRKYNLWGTSVLSRDEMMRRRNSLMQDIPDLVIIGAHMGSLEDDLQRLADTFDKYPNFYVEIGQRHYALGQQPNQTRKLFIKYQDRILFGQDGVQTLETYRNHFRFLETDDDLIRFSSHRPPVHGLNLPDEVLRKIYYGNAAKLMPKVKKALQNQYPGLKFP